MSLSRLAVWALMMLAGLMVAAAGGPLMAQAAETKASETKAADPKAAEHAGDHAGGDHGHIPDPVHGNTNDATYNAVDFREDINIFTAVVFLLLLTGLYFAAWKPIQEGLEKREKSIQGNIESAAQANADAQAKLAAYEAKLASAAEEATRIVAEARKGAETTAARIEAEAQDEAARIRERATAEIDAAKRVALNELASKSTDVAMALAQRIVGREVKAADHQKLIQDMLTQMPSKN